MRLNNKCDDRNLVDDKPLDKVDRFVSLIATLSKTGARKKTLTDE